MTQGSGSSKTLALISMIAGIASLVPGLNLGIIAPIAAIVLGIIANKKANTPAYEGKGMAKAGIILGIVSLCLMVVCVVCYILYIVFIAGVGILGGLSGY